MRTLKCTWSMTNSRQNFIRVTLLHYTWPVRLRTSSTVTYRYTGVMASQAPLGTTSCLLECAVDASVTASFAAAKEVTIGGTFVTENKQLRENDLSLLKELFSSTENCLEHNSAQWIPPLRNSLARFSLSSLT